MADNKRRTARGYAEAIVRRLEEQNETVTFAESCTGGLVAATLVSIAGASHVFREGYLTYCDDSKHRLLGVSSETLQKYTAVSRQTAREMALGAKARAGSDYSIAVTGYADGELENGGHHVIVACAGPDAAAEVNFCEGWYTGDRNAVRRKATYQALKLLWKKVAGNDEMV